MRDYWQKQKWLIDICVIKALPSIGDSLWKQETLGSLHNLQLPQQVGACLIQVAQLVWAPSRQLSLSDTLLGSSAVSLLND